MIIRFSLYGFLKNLKFFDPFFLLFFIERGLSYTQIGILISVRELFLNIFEIPSGLFADVFSKKKAMLLCFASYIISFVIIHFSASMNFLNEYYNLLIAMMFFGIGEAFRSGTHKAIILDYLEHNNMLNEKLHYYSFTRSWSQIGAAISALASASVVFFTNSYEYIFIGSTVPYFLGFLLILTYPDYKSRNTQRFPVHIYNLYKEVFSRKIGSIIITSSLFEATFKAVKDYIQPILKISLPIAIVSLIDHSVMPEEKTVAAGLGLFYFFVYLLSSISSRYSSVFSRLMNDNERKMINITFLAQAVVISLAGLIIMTDLSMLVIPIIFIFSLMFVIYNIRKPVIVSFYGEFMDKKHRAGILSIDSQLKSLFLMLAAPGLGILVDNFTLGPGLAIFGAFVFIAGHFIKLKKNSNM